MRLVRTAIIAGVASAVLAGAAFAARDEARGDTRVMLVALPDGSVQQVRYQGDVAPQVVLIRTPAPARFVDTAFGPDSPFAEMDRISAMMEAQSQAMMRQAAMMQAHMAAQPSTAAPGGNGVVMTNAQGQPVGVMHYSYVSSTTSADGCTQTVSYSSDNAGATGVATGEPKLIRTSSGHCGAAIAPAGNAPGRVTPTATAPAAKPAPKIVPANVPATVPAELKSFTPSRT